MPLGNLDPGLGRQPSKYRDAADRIGKYSIVTVSRYAIEDDSCDLDFGIEGAKPQNQSLCAAGHGIRIDDEDYGQPQPFRYFGGAAGFGFSIEAVEQTHDALDDGHVFVTSCMLEQPRVHLAGQHPAIEIM